MISKMWSENEILVTAASLITYDYMSPWEYNLTDRSLRPFICKTELFTLIYQRRPAARRTLSPGSVIDEGQYRLMKGNLNT